MNILVIYFVSLAVCPLKYIETLPSICLFKNIFHKECLGCGLTRAFSALLHNNFPAALNFNKLSIVFFPMLFCILFYQIYYVLKYLLANKSFLNKKLL
jgi:hypothetical protein